MGHGLVRFYIIGWFASHVWRVSLGHIKLQLAGDKIEPSKTGSFWQVVCIFRWFSFWLKTVQLIF